MNIRAWLSTGDWQKKDLKIQAHNMKKKKIIFNLRNNKTTPLRRVYINTLITRVLRNACMYVCMYCMRIAYNTRICVHPRTPKREYGF